MEYFVAIRLNKAPELSKMLALDPTLVALNGKDGFSGLQLAAKYGFAEIAEMLVDNGALIECTDTKYGRTCLHWAAMCGHSDVLVMLARDHPDSFRSEVDRPDKSGHTALMLACKSGRLEAVKLLVATGARLDVIVEQGARQQSALDMCNGSAPILRVLQQSKQPANSPSMPTASSSAALLWGFSGSVGTGDISQVVGSRSKHVALGWIRSTDAEDEEGGSFDDSKGSGSHHDNAGPASYMKKTRQQVEEVIIKLNKDERELQQELDVRRRMASTPLERLCVRAKHASVVSIPASSASGASVSAVQDWHAIFLEKGIVDLHHLYDAMSQGATHSRLGDARWKLEVLRRLTSIVAALQKQGLVWYDLKPSNFIVFPPAPAGMEKEGFGTVCAGPDSSACTGPASPQHLAAHSPSQWGTKMHLWLQRCQWAPEDFSLKATDLSSVFPAGNGVRKEHISCTTRYMCPALARAMQDSAVTEIAAEPAHMLWALGMSALQLLHSENRTFYAHFGAAHSQEVYAFLSQADEEVQRGVDVYAEDLVRAQLRGKVESEEVEQVLRMILSLLRVEDSQCSVLY